jgi:hypothetical protein
MYVPSNATREGITAALINLAVGAAKPSKHQRHVEIPPLYEWRVIQPQISHTRLIPTIPCCRLDQDAGDLVRGSDGGGPSPRLLERLAVVSGNKNFLMLDFREASF